MESSSKVREWIIAGVFLAIGLVLPMVFHSIGIAGQIFLPMHIPVLIAGFILSPIVALFLGIVTPLLSSVLTGMPIMFPMAIIMMVELGAYGIIVSLLSRNKMLNTVSTLIIAMLLGRVAAGITVFFLVQGFAIKMNPMLFVKGAVLTGLPGIGIQLILIPILVGRIKHLIKGKKLKEQEV